MSNIKKSIDKLLFINNNTIMKQEKYLELEIPQNNETLPKKQTKKNVKEVSDLSEDSLEEFNVNMDISEGNA